MTQMTLGLIVDDPDDPDDPDDSDDPDDADDAVESQVAQLGFRCTDVYLLVLS